ncbi:MULTISPECIES: CoA transferase [unclassified Rathayibacter]|uniref:CaiB/BaiF CoA transferase family protein n=1 Tax=unclassified Rathayibacter TaxID=2609250 RepID=UPI0010520089|nr:MULTISPECIES: CoA transferase [unclassified Rathayibacter]MCJ1675500.1 CoA transferase [Rathayibacter sp. VKM Ac-2929]TCL79448.1 crotonobetainyl-CoA:carnitine CoA-transferase CaiB-like acyl-CoA transferase [Rathayibacter sp. PhB192]TCM25283.1 crotonobetainyl-CoA:carnitine CoA-transferase CaiB-like acyl-CoA transferase [Rathayibacter sp. PhB179]
MTISDARGETTRRPPAKGPFDGLLIADFGRVLAGPYATMLLADLGATVIKVESAAGDETRSWTPPQRDGESTYYLSINRNKNSIVLDLADQDDLRVARRLAERADVVTENFKPGGMKRFGLDYASVSATNPAVVYASITGFGTAGGAGLPGYDLLVQAMSGMMTLTGPEDGEGYRSGVAVFDVITGLHTAIGIVTALYHRERTGEGQHVELNLLSSALSGLVNQTGGYLLSGKVPTRLGNDHPSIYPYAPFPTADGELVLTIGNDAQFGALCDALGLAGVAADPRFCSNALRSAHRSELRPLLVARLAGATAQEWFERLSALRLPCAPVLDVAGGIAFAESIGLDPVVTAGTGERAMPGIRHPITFSRTPADYRLGPPALGQDGDSIRAWLEGTDELDPQTMTEEGQPA